MLYDSIDFGIRTFVDSAMWVLGAVDLARWH